MSERLFKRAQGKHILGIGNLYLHRISNTSSRNPRKVAISKLNKLAKYVEREWCGKMTPASVVPCCSEI
jgi:hypothetical protein